MLGLAASTDDDGYGRFCLNGKRPGAHRVAHYLATGNEPPVVMHTCGRSQCVNPFHLRGGTQGDNVHDAVEKGRHQKGIRNGRSKLDAGKVRSIRERLASDRPPARRALAREFEVDESTIRQVARWETWAHID